jgi:Domain of unknown function (DUF4186)
MMVEFKKPEPLKIKCTASDCDHDLHCFKSTRKMAEADRGRCRACGADLVDWQRLSRREISDAKYTFRALKHEMIRNHFFLETIDDKAVAHARRKGRIKLGEAVRHRLERYLAPEAPVRDGFQTPFAGNAIYYAQHATACCCRTCLEYWHSIPKGRALTERELEYCEALINLFLRQRLPKLKDEPEKVPPRRHLPTEGAAK